MYCNNSKFFDGALRFYKALAIMIPWMLPVRNLAIGHAIAACSSNDFDCVGRQPPPRQWPIIGQEAASRTPSYLITSNLDARFGTTTQLLGRVKEIVVIEYCKTPTIINTTSTSNINQSFPI